jgi:tRNA(Ile)-lysidine synthase
LPVRALEITIEIGPFSYEEWLKVKDGKPTHQEWLDFDQVRPPLVVRPRLPGERFHPLGAPGGKKLKDFFIDAKIPPEQREQAAILHDQIGPIWVIGHRIDERCRLTRETKQVLKITARPIRS